MNKILLIAKREFLSRVQKKTFLLTTILLPLIIAGFYALMIYFSVKSGDKTSIAVVDKANLFNGKIDGGNDVTFQFLQNETTATLADKVKKSQFSGYIYIPETTLLSKTDSIQVVTEKSAGLITKGNIEDLINKRLEEQRLLALHISKDQLDSAQQSIKIKFPTISGSVGDEGKETVSYIVGYASGFLIYIILFIYGTMVMRGVMEEKVSRIAEVIVSSVKPFQLMMGKITGIGAVGLVQFIIWIILGFGTRFLIMMFYPSLFGASGSVEQVKTLASDPGIFQGIASINWPMIIICFFFYFLGGYLLYSALFAAVGSAVNEDPQDAQSLMLPITMPIIFAIVIMTKAVNDPSSGLALFGSIFPLTSPIVMIARVAHGVPDVVPYWQLLLSMALLILGFLGTTWLAAKIYRTGILMYGKKPTWKELIKWGFRKN
ncbi:MAG: ABC transporter permease [Bacteroidetes bacterium]|nr:ABC transporter permease [Bacteroidota bacterium]